MAVENINYLPSDYYKDYQNGVSQPAGNEQVSLWDDSTVDTTNDTIFNFMGPVSVEPAMTAPAASTEADSSDSEPVVLDSVDAVRQKFEDKGIRTDKMALDAFVGLSEDELSEIIDLCAEDPTQLSSNADNFSSDDRSDAITDYMGSFEELTATLSNCGKDNIDQAYLSTYEVLSAFNTSLTTENNYQTSEIKLQTSAAELLNSQILTSYAMNQTQAEVDVQEDTMTLQGYINDEDGSNFTSDDFDDVIGSMGDNPFDNKTYLADEIQTMENMAPAKPNKDDEFELAA